MGCGNAKRPNTQGSDRKDGLKSVGRSELVPFNQNCKGMDWLGITKGCDLTPNKEAPTVPGSFFEGRDPLSECPVCASSVKEKVHILDCMHSLCVSCAAEQMSSLLKTRQGNITFLCKKCRAPKYLSNEDE